MTTNQTIDGVPGLRELLIEVLSELESNWRIIDSEWGPVDGGLDGAIERGDADEIKDLRALLDSSITDNGDKPDEERSEALKDMLNFFEAAHARWISGGNSNFCLAALEEMYDAGYRKKPAAQHQGEPVAWVEIAGDGTFWPDSYTTETMSTTDGYIPLYAEQPEPASSTSDKYKAELYDEVWQKARDMGFGNVTDALIKLERQPAPVAVVLPERKAVSVGVLSESNTHNQGWNACLDELKHLNPSL